MIGNNRWSEKFTQADYFEQADTEENYISNNLSIKQAM